MNKRTLAVETTKKVGEIVTLKGWVHSVRKHGKVLFIDLRDRSGLVQVVFAGDVFEASEGLRPEFVIEVTGTVNERTERYINPKLETGTIEIEAQELTIISTAETPPFPLDTDGREIDEDLRTRYRYLDLRRERMNTIIRTRSKIAHYIRNYYMERDFVDIETPYLSKSTPEGARDFLVPARMHPGEFYALPQSPQQYKQLLMVAGFERYMQFARCFRDEDPRADRAYGEFTQLDLELSFTSREEIMNMMETMVIEIVEKFFPNKTIKETPFPRISYHDAMERYGTDRPDLREDSDDADVLAFEWVVDFPAFEYKEGDKRWGAVHHPFTAPVQEDIPLIEQGELGKVRSNQYDLVLNGWEVAGGSIRITDPELQANVFKALGHSEEDVQEKFGHLLEAFKYGVPPHGGIAMGFGRFIAGLFGEQSLREAVAFPASGTGVTAVMEAPSAVSDEQLKELHIAVDMPKNDDA